ncbi:MAG: MerR family transcriptional regulator [Deltaproteobacteria bacterium]|nr:MAG: MerR family transcriptional regulator [Deltaproteobacteria bacterium]
MVGKLIRLDKLYYRIGEVSRITGVKPHVLRYWEHEFKLRPKRLGGAQRRYRQEDVEKILTIKKLLYEDRFTIAGAKKRMQELRHRRGRQMKMEFLQEGYKEVLQEIKKTLREIKEALD